MEYRSVIPGIELAFCKYHVIIYVLYNSGKLHSEETKKKIAERTKEAMVALKIKKASAIGLSLEAYENLIQQQKQEKKAKEKKGLTEESRRIMSEKARERWRNPEFRRNYTLANVGIRTQDQSTREKIAATLKEKWKSPDFRKKPLISQEARMKISETLKARWRDPEFRSKMQRSFLSRNPDWKSKIAMRMREKWQDDNYRDLITTKLRETAKSQYEYRNLTNVNSSQMSKYAIISLVKRAIRSASIGDTTIQSIVGPEIWEEERVSNSKSCVYALVD